MSDSKPVVFLLDDDSAVLSGLRRLLRAKGFAIQSFTSPREFLEQHDASLPGCLVCDVRMPGLTGLELQRALAARGCPRAIVFITGYGDIRASVQAMRAGAITFLPKPVRRAELTAAVEEAIQKDLACRAQQQEQALLSQRLASLTAREKQVLELVACGRLNKQIAAELGAAEKTIKVHRGRLMEKMQVKSVAGLVSLLAGVTPRPSDSAPPAGPTHS
jgi:FixJ family two-component response regulator